MRFSKWHALGNAYLLVERADLPSGLDEALARRLCDPHTGVGADGVLEVAAADGATADIVVWNPDGSRAEFSGNGARIAARWLADRSGAGEVRLRFDGREVAARMRAAEVELDVGRVEVGKEEELEVAGERVTFTPVSVGNPHAVLRLDFAERDVHVLGPLVETHERFPQRTNVQLVRVAGPHELRVGIWERGAGATWSSGSSAVAAAAAAVVNGWCKSPVTVVLPNAGDLRVELDGELHARLTGPVEEICRGEALAL